MSLINDMLRNLEAKRPDDLARQDLQREIRALPAARASSGAGKGLLVLGLVAVVVGVVWQQGLLVLPDEASPAAPVPIPPVAAPQPAQPVVVPPASMLPTDDKLRLASELETLPLPAAPVLAVPDPLPPKAEAPAAEAARPAGPVKIEKSPLPLTARERAEIDYRRAEAALATGRSGEALEALRTALKTDPAYVQARQVLLRQLVDQRKTDEAMGVLQEGLDLQPAQTGWAMSLARLQLEQGDAAAADKTLARSQGYAEANADFAAFQGHVKTRLGALRPAVGHYQRATRLAPGEGRWWLGLGLALEADGKPAEAKDALRRALASGNLTGELAAVAEQHLR